LFFKGVIFNQLLKTIDNERIYELFKSNFRQINSINWDKVLLRKENKNLGRTSYEMNAKNFGGLCMDQLVLM
jgi:hypothetical protein